MNKNITTGEMIDEARIKSGEPELAGHDIMALERFGKDTRHMIVFDVLSNSSPVGNKGERMRLFLTDVGYQKALESQSSRECKIFKHAKVVNGDIFYDRSEKPTSARNVSTGKIPDPKVLREERKVKMNMEPPRGGGMEL